MLMMTIEDIASIIDDPSNGMTLEANAHRGIDDFAWSLKKVDNVSSHSQVCFITHPSSQTPNTYNIIDHRPRGLGLGSVPKRRHDITFQDFSARYTEAPSPPRKKQRNTRSGDAGDEVQQRDQGIALPNPLFIRIHSAIAGVFHMSGAGEEIDAVIHRASGGGAPGGVLVGDDFETRVLCICGRA
jgi:hypothetical protein